MSAFTFPHIQRGSPVAVTADTPILYIFQPVSEASLADTFRNPVDRIVVADQVFLHGCHLDEPGLSCIIDQRSVTSPTVGITVLKYRRIKQQAAFFQVNQHFFVCFFAESTCPRSLCGHLTFFIY